MRSRAALIESPEVGPKARYHDPATWRPSVVDSSCTTKLSRSGFDAPAPTENRATSTTAAQGASTRTVIATNKGDATMELVSDKVGLMVPVADTEGVSVAVGANECVSEPDGWNDRVSELTAEADEDAVSVAANDADLLMARVFVGGMVRVAEATAENEVEVDSDQVLEAVRDDEAVCETVPVGVGGGDFESVALGDADTVAVLV